MMGTPKMAGSIRHYTVFALLLISFVCARVHAQADDKARAAALFDAGVAQFAKGQYARAAQSFLAADEIVPSSQALTNAIDAALRAEEPLIVARTAQRALARPNVNRDAVQAAHTALAEVTPHLARLEVACKPEGCAVRVDDDVTPAGVIYVTPGAHVVVAEAAQYTSREQRVSCAAGALCPVAFTLEPLAHAALLPPSPPAAPVEADVPPVNPPPSEQESALRRHLPMSVFVGGAALTATFAGLTIWSGLSAMSERHEHEDDPAHYDPNEVTRRAHRTDILLGTAVLCAAGTAATALWWVDWSANKRATLAVAPGGAMLVAEGRF
jgi:hypothetical protein